MMPDPFPQVRPYLEGHGDLELAARELAEAQFGLTSGFGVELPADATPSKRERAAALRQRVIALIEARVAAGRAKPPTDAA